MCDWLVVYGVVFTAVTGIFEGANLSGDLKHPNRHIWKGTIIAIYVALITYFFAIMTFAGAATSETLQQNLYLFQDVSFGSPWIIIAGTWVACFSSGLGGIMGGSRILQAIARDRIFPFISIFGRGYGKGDEPRIAVLLTAAIAQGALFIGGLDTIAPIITTFFCLSYALVNMSLLLISVAGTPNFRPRFKVKRKGKGKDKENFFLYLFFLQ
jgi:potassium/chloride transporter 9